eukprot:GILI01023306.1.p1 GENE.GILI01023306.1~~GILI01023306.1.p1  ORF type:complete len:611 (-),score=108.87 GILI01023306.1:54-1856(-)
MYRSSGLKPYGRGRGRPPLSQRYTDHTRKVLQTYSAPARRDFSDVGSESSPHRHCNGTQRRYSAPNAPVSPSKQKLQNVAPRRHPSGFSPPPARAGGGGLAVARQLRRNARGVKPGMQISPRNAPKPFTAFPDHPMYQRLQELNDQKLLLFTQINMEKQQTIAQHKLSKAATILDATVAEERRRLLDKKANLLQMRAKLAAMGSAPEAKAALHDKSAALNVLKNDYQCVMAALKLLEVGPSGRGTIGGVAPRSGAKMKLQANLDRRRLLDEEQLIAKYDSQCNKLRKDIEGLQDYLKGLSDTGGEPRPINATSETSPTRSLATNAKFAAKRNEIDALKLVLEREERQLDLHLSQEEKIANKACEEASMRALAAKHATQEQQAQIASLRTAITSKMALALQRKNETEAARTKIVDVERQIASFESRLSSVEEAIKEGAQNLLAAKLVHAAAVGNNVRELKEGEDLMKVDIANIVANTKEQELRLATLLASKEKVAKRMKVNTERWAQQETGRRKQIDTLEKAKAQQAEQRQGISELKAAHAKELSEAAYVTQKTSIISELRAKYDKESLQLADLEKQNAQLEKILSSTVDLLKRNNVEVLF